jgi:hypothetical protein
MLRWPELLQRQVLQYAGLLTIGHDKAFEKIKNMERSYFYATTSSVKDMKFMPKWLKLFFINCFACSAIWGVEYNYLDGTNTIQVKDLPLYADGVQLEGGWVAQKQLRSDQKYANVSVVWDLPLKGLAASEAFAYGKEKFRESRIAAYNERQAIHLMVSSVRYYLKETKPGQKTVFLFYVGKKTSVNYFDLIERVLKKYDPSLVFEKNNDSGTTIAVLHDPEGRCMEFITHYSWLSSKSFQDASTVVGFSWNGGFNPDYQSGDFVIPTQFIDIARRGEKFSVLFLNEKYKIKNDFQEHLSRFIQSQDQKIADLVNQEFQSENPLKKNHRARLFCEKDFHQNATLLGTWEIFEPSTWSNQIVIPD